jgi:hypothetical protein
MPFFLSDFVLFACVPRGSQALWSRLRVFLANHHGSGRLLRRKPRRHGSNTAGFLLTLTSCGGSLI